MTFPVKMSILKVTNFCEVSVMLFKKNSTILFQGDSITDAGRTGSPDPDSSLGSGYPFFIANLLNATYPDWNLSFINRGVSGNRTLEMSARWEKDCLNLKPDLLSVTTVATPPRWRITIAVSPPCSKPQRTQIPT